MAIGYVGKSGCAQPAPEHDRTGNYLHGRIGRPWNDLDGLGLRLQLSGYRAGSSFSGWHLRDGELLGNTVDGSWMELERRCGRRRLECDHRHVQYPARIPKHYRVSCRNGRTKFVERSLSPCPRCLIRCRSQYRIPYLSVRNENSNRRNKWRFPNMRRHAGRT